MQIKPKKKIIEKNKKKKCFSVVCTTTLSRTKQKTEMSTTSTQV